MTLPAPLFGLILAAVFVPAAALAEPLTIKAGESWVFALERGEPVRAHRVAASAKPGPGQIKATVISTMGTTMTMTNNNRRNYTFRAELVGAPGATTAKPRTCTLPADGPVLEYWPIKAAAVRLSTFKVASNEGNCP